MISDEVSSARKRIFRDGYDISFGELVSLYERRELVIQPEYQRLFRWDQTQKTRFIESLLLNIPIPPIFVFSDNKGRWELVDGLQRVSTILEFMGLLLNEDGKIAPAFNCDGTSLLPSLRGARWPLDEEDEGEDVLPLNLQLGLRRARIRVEILGQETEAHVKYELFQRLNSGGTNLSEQELRNCIVVAISKPAYLYIKQMSENENFVKLARVGPDRIQRQYLLELIVRFLVLRHYKYERGLDVHEYLDKGIIALVEDKKFDWTNEIAIFESTMKTLIDAVGSDAFSKNNRFSLAMYEFITLGLSKALEQSTPTLTFVKKRVAEVPKLPAATQYSGIGIRGTTRLSNFVVPFAESFFLATAP